MGLHPPAVLPRLFLLLPTIYYPVSQLPRLHGTLALEDLGLWLDQVARLPDDDLAPEHANSSVIPGIVLLFNWSLNTGQKSGMGKRIRDRWGDQGANSDESEAGP
jgi:hypothetical protein